MKEEHERERNRWQTKIDEIEQRLVDSETLNSDMNAIKAELNKKIVEMEKSTRPLSDQNRKLCERNKALQTDIKKFEKEMSEVRDELLTLKDQHERVVKENRQLHEKRIEMLEDLQERLTQQQNKIFELEETVDRLRNQLADTQEENELLEFQRIEKEIEIETINSTLDKSELKTRLSEMRNSKNLPIEQRKAMANALAYLESLENSQQSNVSQTKDWADREEQYIDRIEKLQEEVDSVQQKKKQAISMEIQLSEMKQTTLELERAKQTQIKEMDKLRFVLQQKEEQLAKKSLPDADGAEAQKLREEVRRLEIEVEKLRNEQRPAIRTDLERRYEETKYRLHAALEKCSQFEIFVEAAKKTREQRTYNEHLERQFQAQTEIIDALKHKIIQNRLFGALVAKCEKLSLGECEREIFRLEADHPEDRDLIKGCQALRRVLKKTPYAQGNSPLQIATHSKVRPSNSTDSSGCLSAGSDGMGSPGTERASDEEWPHHGTKTLSTCDRSISA
ncbi:unnamed protein product, partial [Mesorhabditis spiculigera]